MTDIYLYIAALMFVLPFAIVSACAETALDVHINEYVVWRLNGNVLEGQQTKPARVENGMVYFAEYDGAFADGQFVQTKEFNFNLIRKLEHKDE